MSKSEKKIETPKKQVPRVEVAEFLSDRPVDYLSNDNGKNALIRTWGTKKKTKTNFLTLQSDLLKLEIKKESLKLKETKTESEFKKEFEKLNIKEKLKYLELEDRVKKKLVDVCLILEFSHNAVTEMVKSTDKYHAYYKENQLAKIKDLALLNESEVEKRQNYFKDRFNAHIQAKNDYLADKEVEWDKRRFDSLSRLIAGNSSCAAVCFDGQKILLSFNEIHDENKNSGKKVVKQKLDLSCRVFEHLKNYAEAASKGEHDQYNVEHNEERVKLLVNTASYYYKGIGADQHPGSHLYNLAMDLDKHHGDVDAVYANLNFANDQDKVVLDAIARARKDLLKLEDALTPSDMKQTLEGKERTFRNELIKAFKEFDINEIKNHLVTVGGNEDKVHAEMRIVEHVSQNSADISDSTNSIYIGISKLCCASCNLYINQGGKVDFVYEDDDNKEYRVSIEKTRGNHAHGYEWAVIDYLKDNKAALRGFVGKQAYDVYQNLMNDDQKKIALKTLRNIADGTKPSKTEVNTYRYYPDDSESETEIDRKNKVRARDAISTRQEADREVMDFEIDAAENKTNLTESSKKRKQVSTPSQNVENPVELMDFGDSIEVGKNSNKTIRQLNFDALEERTPKKTKILKIKDETLSGESISISPDLKKEARLIKEGLKSQSKFSPSSERNEKVRRTPVKTKQSTPEKSFSISSNFDFKFEAQSATKDLKSQRTTGPATPLRSAKPQSPRNKGVSTPKL